jgi:alkanesulfonate monooxygenase SsuD/methylene tetrahydromethanopterin reductase-like flavin-dependent oxidoreductase (luciferase family)
MALRTQTIRIGPGFIDTRRSVIDTARAAATLQELSGDRSFLGVRSHAQGLPCDEWLESLSDVHDQELVPYADPLLELCSDDPMSTAGDRVLLDLLPFSALRGITMGIAEDLGRSYSCLLVTGSADFEVARRHVAGLLPLIPRERRERLGLSDEVLRRVEQGLDPVRDEWVHEFAVNGTPDACAARLRDLSDRFSFDEIVLPVLDLRFAIEAMRTFADVMTLI